MIRTGDAKFASHRESAAGHGEIAAAGEIPDAGCAAAKRRAAAGDVHGAGAHGQTAADIVRAVQRQRATAGFGETITAGHRRGNRRGVLIHGNHWRNTAAAVERQRIGSCEKPILRAGQIAESQAADGAGAVERHGRIDRDVNGAEIRDAADAVGDRAAAPIVARAPIAAGVVRPRAADVVRILRAVVENGNLRGCHGEIRDFHFIQFSIEQRVGGKLAFAEVIFYRTERRRRNRDAAVGRNGSAVDIKDRATAVKRYGDVLPGTGGQRAGALDDLLAAAVVDGETQRRAAGIRREKHVLARTALTCAGIAEIKNTLPGVAAIPINPRGEGERVSFGDIRGKLEVTVRAVQRQGRRLGVVADGECRCANRHGVVVITGGVPGVRGKEKFRDSARAVVRHRLRVADAGNKIGIRRARGRDGVAAGHERAVVLDPIVKRVAFHERRGFQHVHHRRNARLLLGVSRHGIRIVVRPVRAVVPFGNPDGPMRVVPDVEQEIIHLVCRSGRIRGIPSPVIMNGNEIHAVAGGVGLLDEWIEPAGSAGVGRGGRADAQAGGQLIRQSGHGIRHRTLRSKIFVGVLG